MSNFEIQVSIRNAAKAMTALRAYGLSATVAKEIIETESIIAIHDNGIIPRSAISPELIEMFGEQHINDALAYSYHFMEEYNIDWEDFKLILNTLLKVFRAEDLILNPGKIKYFIISLNQEVRRLMYEKGPYASYESLFNQLLYDISDNTILAMSDPYDTVDPDKTDSYED